MFGRARLPSHGRELLEKDEHVLAWATTPGDGLVIATSQGLWWPADPPRRIPWHRIDKVVWSDSGFTVTEADIVDDLLLVDRTPLRVTLAEPRKLPAIVRRRVQSNVVRTEQVRLADGLARVVGRKVAGQDGLGYFARLDPGTPDTALARMELLAIIEPLRAEAAARLAEL